MVGFAFCFLFSSCFCLSLSSVYRSLDHFHFIQCRCIHCEEENWKSKMGGAFPFLFGEIVSKVVFSHHFWHSSPYCVSFLPSVLSSVFSFCILSSDRLPVAQDCWFVTCSQCRPCFQSFFLPSPSQWKHTAFCTFHKYAKSQKVTVSPWPYWLRVFTFSDWILCHTQLKPHRTRGRI